MFQSVLGIKHGIREFLRFSRTESRTTCGKEEKGNLNAREVNQTSDDGPSSNIGTFKCSASIFYCGHSSCKFPKILRQCNLHTSDDGDTSDAFGREWSARMFFAQNHTKNESICISLTLFMLGSKIYVNSLAQIFYSVLSRGEIYKIVHVVIVETKNKRYRIV